MKTARAITVASGVLCVSACGITAVGSLADGGAPVADASSLDAPIDPNSDASSTDDATADTSIDVATDAALDAMRAGILRLNAAHGVVTTPSGGYHETITRAYMRLIGRFVMEDGGTDGWSARAARLLREHGAKDHLLLYYTRDRLMSAEARFGWVEPDLRPLP